MEERDRQRKVINNILRITDLIRIELPELYSLLSETPFFPSVENKVSVVELEKYLDSLKVQYSTFIKSHLIL